MERLVNGNKRTVEHGWSTRNDWNEDDVIEQDVDSKGRVIHIEMNDL